MRLSFISGAGAVLLVLATTGVARAQNVEGVDVSEFQGSVDWAQVHAAGIGFGIARVSDGVGHLDGTFAANWAGMRANGLVRGVYQFFRAAEDPVAQADLVVNTVGTFEAGDLPPVADVEVRDGVGAATLVANLSAWCDRIKARTGLTPIIYTAPGFWDPLGASLPAETLWVANWFVGSPAIPNGWSNWTFWQYVDDGQVPGIAGRVDRDRFQGTLGALEAFAGSGTRSSGPPAGSAIGIACTPGGGGYWLATTNGGVFSYGNAQFHGSAANLQLAAPIVAIAATPSGGGYWLAAADGGVFAFGDAPFFGSMGGDHLNAPIVGFAPEPNGNGYWLVGADGGVFAFGGSYWLGCLAGLPLNAPIVGIAVTPSGGGYWLVAADGGVFAFGNAPFVGSLGSVHLNAPIVGIAGTPSGKGYWLVAADGGVFAFGDAAYEGGAATLHLNAPVAGIGVASGHGGYTLVAWDGGVFTYGGAGFFGAGV
jgi:GH25 family lysozyme M1 (1,4-beta-N-acetylmuramidase)